MNRSFYFNINYTCNSRCLFCASRDPSTGAPARDMSPRLFRDNLVQSGIKAGDTVIINGGEPTIHRKFFSFLEITLQLGAYPVLFTNGLRLHDKVFAGELLNYQPMNIRIPFFGAVARDHDFLTGRQGNFDKTLRGFGNIVEFIGQGAFFDLEAKLLLSKATYTNNLAIAKLLKGTFPHCFYFSINPLIFSEKVMQKKELFLERFSVMKGETARVIRYIRRSGFLLSLNQLPFCLFYRTFPKLFPYLDMNGVRKFYYDSVKTDQGNKTPLGQDNDYHNCANCIFYMQCNGFYPEYLKEYGTEEISPICNQHLVFGAD